MCERGHQHLLVEAEAISEAIGRTVAKKVKLMARMGESLERFVHERYPDFPARAAIRNWEEYLPPLSASLRHLVERYEIN